jgi:threonine/homoserine/homoserine lactone efflux protein
MSTTLTAAVLALVGIIAVIGVAYVFYLVGRAEDRERAAAAEPEEPRPDDHPERNGRLARERRRPLPRRRP